VVVVAYMIKEGPLVPFPMSYYPCWKEFIATYEIRSLSTIIRKVLKRVEGGGHFFNTT
jgi:hypothetical protein